MAGDGPQAQIAAKLDELRHHRSDGYATTADLIRVLEIIEALLVDVRL